MKKTIILIALALMTAMGCWAQETVNATKSWRTLKGYKAFCEVEYGVDVDDKEFNNDGSRINGYPKCTNVMLSTSHGYQFNNIVYFGGGVGLLRYIDGKQTLMPVFADVRLNFMNDTKVLPFFSARLGGVVGAWGGFYTSAWVGARFRVPQRHAVSLSVGLTGHFDGVSWYQADSFDEIDWQAISLGVKLGYEF